MIAGRFPGLWSGGVAHHPSGRRLRTWVVALGVLCAALAGCVSPTMEGNVVSDPQDRGSSSAIAAQAFVDPPLAGAPPQDIIRGFLRASASASRDYEVARLYLAGDAALNWNPYERTTVFSSLSEVVTSNPSADTTSGPVDDVSPSNRAQDSPSADEDERREADPERTDPVAPQELSFPVRLQIVALLDELGSYEALNSPKESVLDFELTQVEGQWRITSAPAGLLVSRSDFANTFRAYSVYFADSTMRFLVPDMRWFPLNDHVGVMLVRSVLNGPSPWLASSLVSGFPAGTRLRTDAVTVVESIADVNLSDEALSGVDPQLRLLMQRQLDATLKQIPGVISARMMVGGTQLAVPGPDDPVYKDETVWLVNPSVKSEPLVVNGTGQVRVLLPGDSFEQRQIQEIDVPERAAPVGRVWAVASSSSDASMAFVEQSRNALWVSHAEEPAVRALQAKTLLAPSLDPQGWAWTADAGGQVWAVDVRTGKARQVATPFVETDDIQSIRVSRDGARAVVLLGEGASSAVIAVGVARSDSGEPAEWGKPLLLTTQLRSVFSVAWVDEKRIALLGVNETGAGRVYSLQLGGPALTNEDSIPAGATVITAGNGLQDLLLGTGDGRLFGRVGASWISATSESVYRPNYSG